MHAVNRADPWEIATTTDHDVASVAGVTVDDPACNCCLEPRHCRCVASGEQSLDALILQDVELLMEAVVEHPGHQRGALSRGVQDVTQFVGIDTVNQLDGVDVHVSHDCAVDDGSGTVGPASSGAVIVVLGANREGLAAQYSVGSLVHGAEVAQALVTLLRLGEDLWYFVCRCEDGHDVPICGCDGRSPHCGEWGPPIGVRGRC